MTRKKKNNEGEMGSGDSDDEFYNVNVPYSSTVSGDKPFKKTEVEKVYSPPRTKVKYDYKFESSSDEESHNMSGERNKKYSSQKSLGVDVKEKENEKKDKSCGENKTLPQSNPEIDKGSEESQSVRNSGDKAQPDAVENATGAQTNMTSSIPSTVNVPRPQIGVVPPVVVMPPQMVVSQMGPMIVPSPVGMGGQNIMPNAVNLMAPQNMMGVAGGMLRGPNPIGGLITSPTTALPTGMMGINPMTSQMAGVMGIQGNFVGVPGAGAGAQANVMGLQGGMINLTSMGGINMAVPGNMLRMAGAGNSMLRMQVPGGSIMGMQTSNNMLGISGPGSNIMGVARPVGIAGGPGNLMGVQTPTTGMIGNPSGMVVNPGSVINNSLVGNPNNLMVMTGMMGTAGGMVGGVGNPNVVGANQSNLMNKAPYPQGTSPTSLRGVPSSFVNVRDKPPLPGNFRWQTNPTAQVNAPKSDSPTTAKSFSNTTVLSPSSSPMDGGSKEYDEGEELSRDDRDKSLSDKSSNLETDESQSPPRELPNNFKNDGSFMEIFKKMKEEGNLEKNSSERRQRVVMVSGKNELNFKTAPYDPRFPNVNQTKHCYQSYVDFHRCEKKRGEGDSVCKYFYNVYTSLCPSGWVEKWDGQREEGVFPAKI